MPPKYAIDLLVNQRYAVPKQTQCRLASPFPGNDRIPLTSCGVEDDHVCTNRQGDGSGWPEWHDAPQARLREPRT